MIFEDLERMKVELTDLQKKVEWNRNFINSINFPKIPEIHQELLKKQQSFMCGYYNTLKSRVDMLSAKQKNN